MEENTKKWCIINVLYGFPDDDLLRIETCSRVLLVKLSCV